MRDAYFGNFIWKGDNTAYERMSDLTLTTYEWDSKLGKWICKREVKNKKVVRKIV
jgi:hypothetical protein